MSALWCCGHKPVTMLCIVAAIISVACVSPTLAWSPGDIVPVHVYIRINKTMPKSSTPIPYDFCPRFSWPKIVQIPSLDYSSNERDVAIRFEIGRGVNKQTKWMALKELPSPVNHVKAPKHLTMVVFQFGYQFGSVGRFTAFKALATYSERPHETITIKYEWNEHRSYNPHIALGVVSGVAVLLTVFLMHRISSDTLFASRSRSIGRISVVRERSD